MDYLMTKEEYLKFINHENLFHKSRSKEQPQRLQYEDKVIVVSTNEFSNGTGLTSEDIEELANKCGYKKLNI